MQTSIQIEQSLASIHESPQFTEFEEDWGFIEQHESVELSRNTRRFQSDTGIVYEGGSRRRGQKLAEARRKQRRRPWWEGGALG